ncbi:hypothetical protein RhiXN_02047 [Rhizoctonia solani]|uniref:LisH domain-containing protein n=1 Tax=Rhizoctonia solani TaxID=456999 RepID=A0A8H8PCY5_9AGAM|nr:uncharacterized protein RhiXN_02047 [Rhizoctonia solani]QRW27452.1 hypothetical protein RhiXN_02047 [Rhizoctonia solani]
MSLTQAKGGLLSVSDKELRGVVLSYLLYHGHKDTARIFASQISHREDAESIDRCPLWLPKSSSGDASGENNPQPSTHEATPALDHASLPERDNDDQVSNNTKAPHPKENITTDIKISPVSDNVLVDVEVRRKIRQTILSGNIDGAIELINHHLPTFLPVNTPTGGVYNTTSKAPNGSHELSTLTNGSSPTRQDSPPRSPTPVSTPVKTQFVEAVRTVPLPPSTKGHEEAPLKPQTKIGGVEDAKMETPGLAKDQDHKGSSSAQLSSEARQDAYFNLLQGSTRYQSYHVPAIVKFTRRRLNRIIAGAPYLSMSRREAVADQSIVQCCIWAQTAKVVWDQVAAMHAPMPRIDEIPVDVTMYARYVVRSTEGEDQAQENLAVPFDFHSLAQA